MLIILMMVFKIAVSFDVDVSLLIIKITITDRCIKMYEQKISTVNLLKVVK